MFRISDLSDEKCREKLKELVDFLDDLDLEDFFGSEGWKHIIGWED